MNRRVLVAAAWPYASGSRHLGHLASFGVPSDVYARYQRLRGNQVLMVSGTDEHGTPITIRAEREGRSPRALVDHYNEEIAGNLQTMGISYDIFTRTTTANHYSVVQYLFLQLVRNGYVYLDTKMGTYCATCQRSLPDRYVEGTCPHCGFETARGDQCDNCGRQMDPADLIGPSCAVCGNPASFREQENFYLNLPAFADRLQEWVGRQGHWRTNVREFTLGLLRAGLKPRPVTRNLRWGVPIPLPGHDDKRIYVWIDAVVGYLSASMEWSIHIQGDPEAWRNWWVNPDARHSYFIGKDNIVFHSVIFPSILMGAEAGLELPHNVVSTEFLTMEGAQFSASRGVAVWVPDVLERYEPDVLRYYLIAHGPETRDTDFTWSGFVDSTNNELIATWGNLVNRVLTFTRRHFGCVPVPGTLGDSDVALLGCVADGFETVGDLLEACHFKAALGEAMGLARGVNRYLDEMAPWFTLSADPERTGTTLYAALRAIDSLKILLCPFLPHSCQKLHEMLGYESNIAGPLFFREVREAEGETHRVLTCEPQTWVGRWQASDLTAGGEIRGVKPLFKKLDPAVVVEELERMAAGQATAALGRG